MPRERLGNLDFVENKDRKFGSVGKYFIGTVVIKGHQDLPERVKVCFTPTDIKKAIKRAEANPEDFGKRPLVVK